MFKIYSKDDCGFCTQSKMLMDRLQISYEETNIENDINNYRDWMHNTLNMKTVPVIFHEDVFVGGYTDLVDYLIDEDFI